MNKILNLLFFLPIIIPHQLLSQILPKEGATLNYRLIGFSFPAEQNVTKYKIEIAAGNYNTEDSFKRNIILSPESKNNKIIAEVPTFGSQYTWRSVSGEQSKLQKSELHHFSTDTSPNLDTANLRLRILKKAEKYSDAYVFLDANQALYDMTGQPVWFMPNLGIPLKENANIRDLKLTTQGTITFLIDGFGAFEINYNGAILWRTPRNGAVSGDSIERYNHEFTRLANGHYMVMGSERVWWQQPASRKGGQQPVPVSKSKMDSVDTVDRKVVFQTIIEYNEKGNIAWSWKSSPYFLNSDLKFYRDITQKGKIKGLKGDLKTVDVHGNAFYLDENNKVIYIGFRDLSRIIKVKYPEGYVMNTYGEIYKPGVPESGNGLFCGQHAIGISQKGYLYAFNNNSCEDSGLPKLIMMQESPGQDSLKKIWEYQCPVEAPHKVKHIYKPLTAGGNVTELPDESLFASTCGPFGNIFIVTMDKKLLWSAIAERWVPTEEKWRSAPQYRASIIPSRKDLERLIWNAETKEQ